MEALLCFANSHGRDLISNVASVPAAPVEARARQSATMDEQQFHLLYQATARPLLSYLVGMTGCRDAADDLLQETYLRFLSHRRWALPPGEARPYLFRIAGNLLRDRWRRRRESQWPEDFEAGVASDIDAQLYVRQAIQALKPRERQLLWLAYVEGMSHQEIAIATGLAALSIRPLLFRARRKAANLLRPEGKRP